MKRRKMDKLSLIMLLMLLIGIGLLAYPSVASN